MPTDVFGGLLNVNTEIFTAWLPQINWFVPLNYAVTLFGAFVDALFTYMYLELLEVCCLAVVS